MLLDQASHPGKIFTRGLDLSQHERRGYSVHRAILAARGGDWTKAGFERECTRAQMKLLGDRDDDPGRILVPREILDEVAHRDLTVANTGGFLHRHPGDRVYRRAAAALGARSRRRAAAYRIHSEHSYPRPNSFEHRDLTRD